MKITVIGGGGVRSMFLAKSLAQRAEELGFTEIVFMDNDPVKLNIYGKMAKRVAEMIVPGICFKLTMEAKEAIRDADYIITTIRPGEDEARCRDERAALDRGILGQETTGAAGFSFAMRTVSSLAEYCELAKEYAQPGFKIFNFTNPAALYAGIDELYEQIMQKREGVYADASEKTVILGGIMTGMLSHEAVGHTVEADLVLGGSVAAHNLNKQVASELVNLTDFAHTAFGKPCPLPVYVDDEGTEAVDVPLIENGILTGYMNSRESAQHFGMNPGGNARAWMFSDEPLIRMRNTSVHPGKDKLEDMIASIDDGYYLIDSTNGQADTTGEFMFGVSMGYEIKNGKLGKALLDTTISGVAFDMLKTVDMVSDTVVWCSSGFCGKKQPMPVGMGGPALRCKVKIGGR